MTAEERAAARAAGAAQVAGHKLTDRQRVELVDMLSVFRATNQRRNDASATTLRAA